MMDIEEGKALVDRTMSVILSCKTEDQLTNAVKYVGFMYKKLFPPLSILERVEIVAKIEFTKGFAFGRLKHGVDV